MEELFHIGWVVRDCAAAQQELSARLGAGPFWSAGDETRFERALVHGKPVPFSLKIAFGVLGGVLLELLEPLDDRSPHAEFLASRGEGMHHLAFLVADFDSRLAAVRRADPEADLLIDGTGPGNPVRWVYLDGGAAHGTVIELLERTPQAEAIFGSALELVRNAGLRPVWMPRRQWRRPGLPFLSCGCTCHGVSASVRRPSCSSACWSWRYERAVPGPVAGSLPSLRAVRARVTRTSGMASSGTLLTCAPR
jgi:methylmalonyl-CoA/ethylmalonyl-CoA epimerase